MRIPCYLEYDKSTSTVTLRHAKTQTIQMMIKLENSGVGTMERVTPDQDCDNFWIAIKPADSVVFQDVLFDKKKLNIKSIDFELK